jgi:hypothetical protein
MTQLKYILIIVLSITMFTVHAQNSSNIFTTAVPFLTTPTDARASGMGNTGIATSPDVNAVYYNIGKLPFAKINAALSANYSPWLKEWANDMYLASLAGYYKLSDGEALYAAVKYFNPGDLQFTDNNGNHLQSYHPNEYAVTLGYSRKLSDKIAFGIDLKYIHSDLASGSQNAESYRAGSAVAADLGFYYDLRNDNKSGWSFGAQLSNLGSKISYTESATQKDFIPASVGVGTSYTKVFNEQNKISFALDINKLLVPVAPLDSAALIDYTNQSVVNSWLNSFSRTPIKQLQLSLCAEYWYNNQFALRAGYFYEDKTKGDRKYFSAGACVSYQVFTLNFSYLVPSSGSQNKSPLINTMLFGININLGK